MKFSSALPLFISSLATASSSSPGIRGRQLDAFCEPGFNLAWVTFDFNKNWTPIEHGDFVTDIGFGFTVKAFAGEGGVSGSPRIYDSDIVGGLDPDLEQKIGNLVIIQEFNSVEPDDNMFGGTLVFDFDTPTDVYSLQLVDTEEKSKVRVFAEGNKDVIEPAQVSDGEIQDVMIETTKVDKIKIKLSGSGGVGNIKMCIPECGTGL